MPQSLEIPFDTRYSTDGLDLVTLNVIIEPESDNPNTLEGFVNLNLIDVFKNNQAIGTGEGAVTMKNHMNDIDFYINRNGELIVSAEDCDNYSLDSEGNLIYTYYS